MFFEGVDETKTKMENLKEDEEDEQKKMRKTKRILGDGVSFQFKIKNVNGYFKSSVFHFMLHFST